jgi:ribonuclease P protein component
MPQFPQFAGSGANASPAGRPQLMQAKQGSRFPRTARLLRHADFERVYKQGRRHFSANMTVFYLTRTEPEATRTGACPQLAEGASPHVPAPKGLRMGFTVGRALGGAVQRNRMKRRLREAVRLTLPADGVSADVVINPKKSLLAVDFTDIVNEVSRAFVVIQQKVQNSSSRIPVKHREPETESRKPSGGSSS